jgi:hypothetical protein
MAVVDFQLGLGHILRQDTVAVRHVKGELVPHLDIDNWEFDLVGP